MMKRALYFLGGVALTTVVLVGLYFYSRYLDTPTTTITNAPIINSVAPTNQRDVVVLGQRAFGPLTGQMAGAPTGLAGLGGGGGSQLAVAPNMAVREMAPAPGGMIIQPDSPMIRYVYAGAPLELKNKTVTVLERMKNSLPQSDLTKAISGLGGGLINLGSFKNIQVQNIGLIQNQDKGFMISVDFESGTLSVGQNWPLWQAACPTSGCAQPNPIKINDVPNDATVLKLANDFITNHGIVTKGYGSPEVVNDWRRVYETLPNKAEAYIPEIVTVIYPLVIDGQPTYDLSGNKVGLSVSVSIRDRLAVGAWNITAQRYRSSAYDAVTDPAVILKFVEKGGLYGYDYPAGTKTVDVRLGTPTIVYVQVWQYSNNTNQELYVPALVFPVTDDPTSAPYFRSLVIVPLAKDLLDNQNNPPIQIMKSGSSSGSAGSAGPGTSVTAPAPVGY